MSARRQWKKSRPHREKKPNGLTPKQSEAVHAELQRLVSTVGIKTGELNIEILMDKEDCPHFLELGPRAGGNMIPIQLSDAYGVNLIKANVAAAMGEPTNLNPQEPKECYMTYVLHSFKDGIYKGVDYSKEIEPYIYRKVHYKKPGDKVEYFDGAGKALGIVFMRFPDEETMSNVQARLPELIKVCLR